MRFGIARDGLCVWQRGLVVVAGGGFQGRREGEELFDRSSSSFRPEISFPGAGGEDRDRRRGGEWESEGGEARFRPGTATAR